MLVRIVTNENSVILEHELEGNGHEQIHSRKIASDTKAGQCQFQIIDTGGCLLWIGEFNILYPFKINVNAEREGLQISAYWPNEPGSRFSSVFENFLLLYHINCTTNFASLSTLSCDAGKGQLVLLCYRKEFGSGYSSFKLNHHKNLTQNERLWKPDSHQASVLQHILFYPVKTKFQQDYLRIKSEELFLLYLQACSIKSDDKELPGDIIQKMQDAEQHIRNDISQHYNIDELARKVLLNSSKLQHYFKIYFGCPLHQYVLSLKMKTAQRLLSSTDKTSKEIAFDLGYKSDANFSEAFKKYFGYPPGQLRKKK